MPIGWDAGPESVFELSQGWSRALAIGRRFGSAAGVAADVWPGPTAVRPLPLAAKAMSLVSSGADVFGVGGAQRVTVTFVDAAGDWRVSDQVAMNGATPVPITYKPSDRLVTAGVTATPPDGTSVAASIYRVQSVSVSAALGQTEANPRANNLGNVTVVDTATGLVVYDYMPAGFGRSQSAAFYAPRNFESKVHKMNAGVYRTGGAARAVIDIGLTLGPGTAYQRLGLMMINDSMGLFTNDPATTAALQQADFGAVMTPNGNTADGLVVLEFRLRPLV